MLGKTRQNQNRSSWTSEDALFPLPVSSYLLISSNSVFHDVLFSSNTKSKAEAINLVDDLKKFASAQLQDEFLVAAISKVSQLLEETRLLQQAQTQAQVQAQTQTQAQEQEPAQAKAQAQAQAQAQAHAMRKPKHKEKHTRTATSTDTDTDISMDTNIETYIYRQQHHMTKINISTDRHRDRKTVYLLSV